jgi:lysophospholipase
MGKQKKEAQSVFRTADDGAKLHLAQWASGQSKSVLILPGRGEPVEKYAPVAERLLGLGCDVWGLDWRGQGRSPRFAVAGSPALARRGHVQSFERLVDDAAAVIRGFDQPVMVLAHSMGGALFLRLLQKDPAIAAHLSGALLSGPMIDIPTGRWAPWVVRWTARLAVLGRRGHAYAPGYGDWVPRPTAFEGNRGTSCPDSYRWEQDFLAARPELQVGGPTWRWVAEAYRLMGRLWQPWPQRFPNLPVRVVVGDEDRYVQPARHRAFFARFPQADLHWIPGGRHELLFERSAVQAPLWVQLEQMLSMMQPAHPSHQANQPQEGV